MPRGRHRRISHRKPSPTAHRTAVGAAVFSTAAGPVLGVAGTAHAAGIGTWQQVAQCESSGNWQTDTGNGYYGGLQFAESTWLGYGGGQYAEYANQATEAQQIAIAEKVLAAQGPGAWPVCGPRAGLSLSDAYVTAAPEIVSAPKAAAVPLRHATTTAAVNKLRGYVIVQAGQSLSTIAAEHHLAGGWEALWRANAETVRDPNLIYAGQRLNLPSSSTSAKPSTPRILR